MRVLLIKVQSYWRRLWEVPLEIALILLLTTAPVALAEFWHRSRLTDKQLADSSFLTGFIGRFSLADTFAFATGVLGTSAIYFLLRPNLVRSKNRLVFTGFLLPFFAIFFAALINSVIYSSATPVATQIKPNDFIEDFAIFVIFLMILSWLCLLVEQRLVEPSISVLSGKEELAVLAERAKGLIE